ncbi:MAG: arylamine N-acetyltransferase [Bauldia sp.]|nr:arylamine N-acetyltransferase [Bauldia sp.]
MTPDLLQAYLARLGLLSASLPPTRDTLILLQRRHMERVPFENLDVVGRRPIALGAEAALEKVVRRGRGGFCFELNEAFRALLAHLGFAVTRIEGRVHVAATGGFGAPFDHLALVVSVPEGDFLADVGFGDGPREPLPWPEGEWDDAIAGAFRLAPVEDGLVELSAGPIGETGFVPLYRVSREPQPIEAFAGMCAFHQTDAASFFTRGPIATIALPAGRVTLTADKVIVTRDGGRTETPYAAEDRASLLRQHFAIETP